MLQYQGQQKTRFISFPNIHKFDLSVDVHEEFLMKFCHPLTIKGILKCGFGNKKLLLEKTIIIQNDPNNILNVQQACKKEKGSCRRIQLEKVSDLTFV